MKQLTVFLLIVTTTFVQAQEQRSYRFSLDEAITFALDSSYATINARRDIAKAIKQKWETTASGLPQINAEISYQNQLRQPTSLLPGEIVGGEPGTFVPVIFGVKQNALLNATLTQLIFDGSYLVGLQAARTFLAFSDNAYEKTQLEVRKGVINAYGGVLIAQESVRVLDRNIAALKKNLDETKIIVQNGLGEEEDAEQLELTYQQLLNQRNNAQRMKDIALQMFNNALGLPVDTKTELTQSLSDIATPAIELVSATPNVEQNVDFKIATNLTEQRALELKLEKSRALPSLSGFINYGTQTGRNEFDFFQSSTPWFAQSIAGIQMNIPIFSSGMRSAKTAKAKIALDQAQTDLENTVQQIQLAFAKAKNDHEFAIDTYNNKQKNLALAERIERKNEIKFKEGIGSSFDLRQAQTQLYSIQQEVLQSMLNIVTTKAELETILNTPDFSKTN